MFCFPDVILLLYIFFMPLDSDLIGACYSFCGHAFIMILYNRLTDTLYGEGHRVP